MAVIASGTITPVAIGTEELVTSQTAAGYYLASFNLANMADGDEVEFTIRMKVLPTETLAVGASAGIVYRLPVTYQDALANPVILLPPLHSEHEFMLAINQTAGVAKAFAWSVDSP